MTTSQGRPEPGWYADPEDPRGLRWWDGFQWTLRKPLPPEARPAAELGRGFQRLALAARTGVRIYVMVAVGQILLYAWGVSMIDGAIAGGDFDRLSLFDDLDRGLSIAILAVLFPTGICWMVWQYQLADAARPGELRRGPGWHAWGYVVPIVNLWFPYQNMVDLHRRRFPGRPGTLIGWWWFFFVVSTVLDRIYAASFDSVDTPGEVKALMVVGLLGSVCLVLAAPFALKLNRDLSDAEKSAAESP